MFGRTCFECKRVCALDGILTVGSYNDEILRKAVHALKFEGVKDMAKILGQLLSEKLKFALEKDVSSFVLNPLPLHPRRERFRGFNQSQLIAKEISRNLNIPVVNLLKKVRSTSPQASIDSKFSDLRKQNISKVFELHDYYLSNPIPEKIILIDDVFTTGSTMEEAAKVLSAHDAEEIRGAVVCRG